MTEMDIEERRWQEAPEGKLELIGGRLIVGNSLAGSRYLLWSLLQDLGPHAALALAPLDRWWAALGRAFDAPPHLSTSQDWEAWAAGQPAPPQPPPTGPSFDPQHYAADVGLTMALWQAAEGGNLGRVLRHDFVMRLGDDGFTPDLLLIGHARRERLLEHYLDGPADLVIEIILPGGAAPELETKRRLYAAGGVPSYWVVDPAARTVTCFELQDGTYAVQQPDADGRYRPSAISELAFEPTRLWDMIDEERLGRWGKTPDCFEVVAPAGKQESWPVDRVPYVYDPLPFAPRITLQPTPISFDEYIGWCPEAKFERVDGMPYIGGWNGTRNALGLLLMTFGLENSVILLSPQAWVAALGAEQASRQQDAARRDQWWSRAHEVVEDLRRHAGVERAAVIGDLVHPAPLDYWSELTLVVWDLPPFSHPARQAVYRMAGEPRLALVDPATATPAQRRALEHEAVAV